MKVRTFLLAMLCLAAFAGRAHAADELDEVSRLHRTGQDAAALQQADRFLAAHPRDPQMRFMKAVILGDEGRTVEARTILESLTEDYPDLAEPYNNLAALYAASGDYPKARAALEQALRLKPDYVTAHENLGDIYATLAGRSYAEALRLDPARPGIAAKLALVRQLAVPRGAGPTQADPASGPTK